MDINISPKYIMTLIERVENKLWYLYNSYDKVRYYLEKWHNSDFDDYGHGWENITFYTKDNNKIDLTKTLHSIDGETIIKIAIDLELETPGFIPCIPMFKNELKDKYVSAIDAFNKATANIEENPDLAISLVNSTLESILKEISKDSRLGIVYDEKLTLYDLAKSVLKGLKIYPNDNVPKEIKEIGSSLMKLCQNIESLRSTKTLSHGKTSTDYIVDEPLYAYFVVNSVVSVGLFVDSFYKKKFPPLESQSQNSEVDNLPFPENKDDLPF